jgi:hypothetical protein
MNHLTCATGSAEKRLAAVGAAVPELMIPGRETDLAKWAVIACDQFTHDRTYWERVRAETGTAPSTLDCIIPEAFLGENGEKIDEIHAAMKRYLDGGFFTSRRGCVYIERDTPYRKGRRGLLVCLDLERYDWIPGTAPLVRPTEGTVRERLPPRMDARRAAALELSHILVLIDDETDTLLPTLGERAKTASGGAPLYDTSLMFDSGRVRGWLLDREADMRLLADGLEKLAAASLTRYGMNAGNAFLYAVGDGNHSLAAAKGVWEEYKQAHGISSGTPGVENSRSLPDHPCRYALVEIENLYDPALVFEPIHRFVFGAGIAEMEQTLAGLPSFSLKKLGGIEERGHFLALVKEPAAGTRFGLAVRGPDTTELFLAEAAALPLALDYIQPLLDDLLEKTPRFSMDYIHGEDELFGLASRRVGTALLLPPFNKHTLFRDVAARGILPRKSFSMGEAAEKRFYLECRKLFG